jgi:4-hydroxy-2-oxoglutarate aldolase
LKHQHQTEHQSARANRLSDKKLCGILLPFTTPFDDDERVQPQAVRSNIEKWNEAGVAGYVALGSTGERVHLDDDECLRVIEAAREATPESMAFVVGAGQQSTRATIDEVRRFVEAGADAVLVLTPHFYRAEMTQAALLRHYRLVADASPAPVLLYNVPQFTGMIIQPETIAQLAEHQNIAGVKDSSGDVLGLAETLRLVPSEFAVLTGHGSALYAALCAGARGAILAIGCVAPRACVALYEAVQMGEHERARDLQRRLTLLVRGVASRYGIGGMKAALDSLGYTGGTVRAPLRSPERDARREIAQILQESALFDASALSEEGHRLAGASTE